MEKSFFWLIFPSDEESCLRSIHGDGKCGSVDCFGEAHIVGAQTIKSLHELVGEMDACDGGFVALGFRVPEALFGPLGLDSEEWQRWIQGVCGSWLI